MRFIIILLSITFLFSCKKKEQEPDKELSKFDVLILNEGNFGWGEASISKYNSEDKAKEDFAFKNKNDFVMGNVLQSGTLFNHKLYWVINNSQKIVVTDTGLNHLGTIKGLPSPRYFYGSSDVALVTDLYANKLYKVNVNTFAIVDSLVLNGWCEQAVETVPGTFWVANRDAHKLYKLNLITWQILDSISTPKKPSEIAKDKNGNIWLLCLGNEKEPAKLVVYNKQMQILKQFDIGGNPLELKVHATGVYYLNKDVFKVDYSMSNPQKTVNLPSNSIPYGLGIHPKTNEIYVADAIDYVQRASIQRYNPKGELLHEFKAGVLSNGFLFLD